MEDEFVAGYGSDVFERTLSMHADDASVRQTCSLVMSRDFFPAAVRAVARREPQFPRGLRVLLHGLRARPELNGGAAEVIGAVAAASGRIPVQLIAPAQFAGERG